MNRPPQNTGGDHACTGCESLGLKIVSIKESHRRQLQAVSDERDRAKASERELRRESEQLRARVAAAAALNRRREVPSGFETAAGRDALRLQPAAFYNVISALPQGGDCAEAGLFSSSNSNGPPTRTRGRSRLLVKAERQEEEETSDGESELHETPTQYQRDYGQTSEDAVEEQGSSPHSRITRRTRCMEPPHKRRRTASNSPLTPLSHGPAPAPPLRRPHPPRIVILASHPRRKSKLNPRLRSAFGVKLPPMLTDGDAYDFELPPEVLGETDEVSEGEETLPGESTFGVELPPTLTDGDEYDFELPGKKLKGEVSKTLSGTNERKPGIIVGDAPRARALEALGVCSTKF
ncbi:hypothetical protein DFH07DRAFT_832998 [Mycena maculata]|uniref:Uncharacterized protein n=1 Tax=Mycena maculata TaxID=230809 RepID=A0AAD7N4A1_9AGAR|nr:hypothetical protein DFH07DRAFT_832998 [Mycena maculata]